MKIKNLKIDNNRFDPTIKRVTLKTKNCLSNTTHQTTRRIEKIYENTYPLIAIGLTIVGGGMLLVSGAMLDAGMQSEWAFHSTAGLASVALGYISWAYGSYEYGMG